MSTEYLSSFNSKNMEMVSIMDELPFWSAPFGIQLLDAVRYRRNIRVLDIGFGTGFPLLELAMRLGNSSRVVGLDPWKAGHKRTKDKIRFAGIKNVDLVVGDAERMPFKDESFDLIVSNNGLNNVSDLSKAIKECARVAKKGASFVFSYNTQQTFHEFYSLFRQSLRKWGLSNCLAKLEEHIYSKRRPLSEYKNELLAAGFKIQKIKKDVFVYRFTDGTAMLNHSFIKLAFLPAWQELVPKTKQKEVFEDVEQRMNSSAKKKNGFTMTVPFAIFDCIRQ